MSNTISQSHAVGLGPLVIALAFSCAACKQSPEVLVVFRTEQQAKDHCPDDTIVWVDPQSATYSLKANASSGGAGRGRYACRREAESAGMREQGL
jgi:hypothetical protein